VSKIVRLEPNDLVALGDPGNPSGYIDNATQVTCAIESIGELQNSIERLS
jgi:2-keto-4-pentenoate hydratase/2-oxohepta-3-ene-1,7-dioic acid hydratase in catechol pathway